MGDAWAFSIPARISHLAASAAERNITPVSMQTTGFELAATVAALFLSVARFPKFEFLAP